MKLSLAKEGECFESTNFSLIMEACICLPDGTIKASCLKDKISDLNFTLENHDGIMDSNFIVYVTVYSQSSITHIINMTVVFWDSGGHTYIIIIKVTIYRNTS